jgi:1,4-dihydroxy-2-naphthoate octaprenyltransferase
LVTLIAAVFVARLAVAVTEGARGDRLVEVLARTGQVELIYSVLLALSLGSGFGLPT